MSHNNNSGNFFKFKNVQLVCKPNTVRQTRQNTQITTQGTAKEQFVEIEATACAETLQNIDDILTDDDSVDYSALKQQPLEPQVQVQNNNQPSSDADEPNTCTPELIMDSSVDTSSIEVIQPNELLEIKLPINLPQRALPNFPQSPRTNVAASIPHILFTDDEDPGEQQVPFKPITLRQEHQGRRETLSPIPHIPQTVRSAIELTVNDLEPSDQHIIDKCGEVDFQLSNHRDWSQPNIRLCQDICTLLPILFQSGFNTAGLPNLEKYWYETVGCLLHQSLLRLALDSVFEEFPEISAIQTKVYCMLKCHLSIINQSGANFHNVSGAKSRPDLSLQTNFNETYYSVYSQAQ